MISRRALFTGAVALAASPAIAKAAPSIVFTCEPVPIPPVLTDRPLLYVSRLLPKHEIERLYRAFTPPARQWFTLTESPHES